METKFNIFESRGTILDETAGLELLKRMLSEHSFLNNPKTTIYRGSKNDAPYMSIDPSNFSRISANTSNHYTLWMDNDYSWKSYPKRSKSIICSTYYGYALSFSMKKPYVVIPLDVTAKFGVCSNFDLWESFNISSLLSAIDYHSNEIYTMAQFNELLSDMNIEDTDYNTMVKQLQHKIDIDEFRTAMSPEYNNFRLRTFKDICTNSFTDNEVWTSSKCLLVRADIYNDLVN